MRMEQRAKSRGAQSNGRAMGCNPREGAEGLYVVATPNWKSGRYQRARPSGARAGTDLVAAEDTRTTEVCSPTMAFRQSWSPLHEHNETMRAAELVARIVVGQEHRAGERCRHPGISDPGALLVAQAMERRSLGLPDTRRQCRDCGAVGFGLVSSAFSFLRFPAGESRGAADGAGGAARARLRSRIL